MRATESGEYMVLVEDDGIGIQDKVLDGGPGEHLGLKILQERAARIHGDLKIESESSEGTRIILRFPQPREEPAVGHTVEVAAPVRTVS